MVKGNRSPGARPKHHASKLRGMTFNYNDVRALVEYATKPRDKAFICLLFLTGARVSEIVGSTVYVKYYVDIENMRKYRKPHLAPQDALLDERMEVIQVPPLTTYAYEKLLIGDHPFVRFTMPVLKRRETQVFYVPRMIPANDNEFFFIQTFEEYLNTRKPGEPMFKFSRITAHRILNRASERYAKVSKTPIHCHFLRHLRHRLMSSEYMLDGPQLQGFSAWKTPHMAMHYASQSQRDLVNRIINSGKVWRA